MPRSIKRLAPQDKTAAEQLYWQNEEEEIHSATSQSIGESKFLSVNAQAVTSLATAHSFAGNAYLAINQLEQAADHYRSADALFTTLVESNPQAVLLIAGSPSVLEPNLSAGWYAVPRNRSPERCNRSCRPTKKVDQQQRARTV